MNEVTIYFPATKTKDAQPAPPLLTEREVLRLFRLSRKDGYQVLYRMRQNGLMNIRVANEVRYLLSDVMDYMRSQRDKAAAFASKNGSNGFRSGKAKLANRSEVA